MDKQVVLSMSIWKAPPIWLVACGRMCGKNGKCGSFEYDTTWLARRERFSLNRRLLSTQGRNSRLPVNRCSAQSGIPLRIAGDAPL